MGFVGGEREGRGERGKGEVEVDRMRDIEGEIERETERETERGRERKR